MTSRPLVAVTLISFLVVATACTPDVREATQPELTTEDLAQLAAWQQERIEDLLAVDGWLNLIGLHWLEKEPTSFGVGPDNHIVLPALPALEGLPPSLGTLQVAEDQVIVEPCCDLLFEWDGPPDSIAHQKGASEPPEALTISSPAVVWTKEATSPSFFKFAGVEASVIARGSSLALRLRDLTVDTNSLFQGIETFEPSSRWILEGQFEPYDRPREIPFPNQTNLEYPQTSSGELVLNIEGLETRISVLGSQTGIPLFLVVGDLTNGHESYGGGRFVYTEIPEESGRVSVDFNRLYNPPCVFTQWATCPLPPKQNQLPIRIEAGEKKYLGSSDEA